MLQGLLAGVHGVSGHEFDGVGLPEFDCTQMSDHLDDTVFSSDEFRMYSYKIKRCPKTRSHDWTECPYAHRGEKAQRRDPRKFHYSAVACPAFRHGSCSKGEFCEFSHGVFEYWLHPARYRTRACNAGHFCQRKVCFFAHSPEQLRSETKPRYHFNAFRSRLKVARSHGGTSSEALSESSMTCPSPETLPEETPEMVDVVNSLKGLKIGERESGRNLGPEVSDLDLPHIGWISELVQ